MAYSLYDATIVTATAALTSLNLILTKAEQHPNSSTLPSARLYEDMFPLSFQVHFSTSQAEKMAARLSGREPAGFEDNLTTFEAMHARIDQVLEVLGKVDKDTANKNGEVLVPTTLGPDRVVDISGKVFSGSAIMPVLFFHVSMAYAILRKEGVPLSKTDYIGSFVKGHW